MTKRIAPLSLSVLKDSLRKLHAARRSGNPLSGDTAAHLSVVMNALQYKPRANEKDDTETKALSRFVDELRAGLEVELAKEEPEGGL
jgi:hypothetical protein